MKGTLTRNELIGLVATTMALFAFAIDMMLAGLGMMAAEFGLIRENDRQLVIVAFIFGAGLTTLAFGPLTDRFGRRSVFLWTTFGFVAATILCIFAPDFHWLVGGRFLQGAMLAGGRVVSVAMVRDVCKGREMASIMSMALTVGMVSPILAPSFGQLILLFGPWRWVFWAIFIIGAGLFLWAYLRMPETMGEHQSQPLSFSGVRHTFAQFFCHHVATGYMIASVFLQGVLFAYVISSHQIYSEAFDMEDVFALLMGLVAGSMALAAFLNSWLVLRLGMRRLSHGSIIMFALLLVVNSLYLGSGGDAHIFIYTLLLIGSFFAMGLINANFGAIIMEPLGHLAGTASAVTGFTSMTFGAVLGGLAAAQYDGRAYPVVLAMTAMALCALICVFITEKGRLFHDPQAET